MADIPGLIEGAAEGAGLGIRFLRHLSRTRLLVHLVDLAPFDGSDPAADAVAVVGELVRFDAGLAARERWLVLNKTDLVDEAEAARLEAEVTAALVAAGSPVVTGPAGPRVYRISALAGQGTTRLTADLMSRLEELGAAEVESGGEPAGDAPGGAPTSSW